MKRVITKREEEAYRYRHHDFLGLTVTETAKKMGVTERQVERLLHNMEKKAPQLFPILTKRQVQIYELWLGGDAIEDIAIEIDIMEQTVQDIVQTVREKLGVQFIPHGRILSYTDSMEGNVKEGF